MVVYINNQKKEFDQRPNISGMLELVSSGNLKGIAIAVNDQVVPRARWSDRLLEDNDKVTIIKASQGG
jgi:sulfur carrier protein